MQLTLECRQQQQQEEDEVRKGGELFDRGEIDGAQRDV